MNEDYFVGVNQKELSRLKDQHEAWHPETKQVWADGNFGKLKSIIDLGCGPGFTSLELAHLLGKDSTIYALDKAEHYLSYLTAEAERQNINNLKISNADITTSKSFDFEVDGVFCRWFLAFLIKDLNSVVRTIHSILKPGGTLALMEYLTLESTTISPPSVEFDSHTKAWINYYMNNGGDTKVGTYLPQLLQEQGFEIVSLKCVGGHAPSKHRWWRWWGRLISDFSDSLEEQCLMKSGEAHSLQEQWGSLSEDPNAFIYTPTLLQIVARKK